MSIIFDPIAKENLFGFVLRKQKATGWRPVADKSVKISGFNEGAR